MYFCGKEAQRKAAEVWKIEFQENKSRAKNHPAKGKKSGGVGTADGSGFGREGEISGKRRGDPGSFSAGMGLFGRKNQGYGGKGSQ